MQHNEAEKQQERFTLMTEAPVRRLVLKMAVPTIISMVVSALYNVADAAFVGHLSTEATAGVGIAFAYMTFVQAIGFFFGHGSGNFIARALGARRLEHAEKMAATGVCASFAIGIAGGVVGLCLLPQLLQLLGTTPDIADSARSYLIYLLIATPFMMSCLTMNNQLRLQGSAHYAMIGLASGAVLNILLDPLFIYVFRWGVAGASAATLCSQFFSWLLLLQGTRREGNVHIRLRNFTPAAFYFKEITRGGLPSLCRQSLICLSTICLNRAAAVYAHPGMEASTIAAFAVVSRIMMFGFSVILGLGQGFQPVCGFNYGARRFGRVRESYFFTMEVSAVLLLIMTALGWVFAPELIAFFRDEDPELIAIGTRVLRWQCAALPLIALTTATNMLFQTTGQMLTATLLSMCRQGLFFLPILWMAPRLFGLTGLEATQAVADMLTFLFTLPFSIAVSRELKKKR
ncbi:MAG: MATE family efflux transporter [Bacteroidales bacterium]|nr:MATE family efflux transporter [Bacteroidales bacterium]